MVDWSKPIEAVHEDGRVGSVEAHTVPAVPGMAYGGRAGAETTDSYLGGWRSDGSPLGYGNRWTIRNVQPAAAKPAISDELVERMVALVSEIGSYRGAGWFGPNNTHADQIVMDARAIVKELPQPIDPAIAEARKLAADFLLHGHGSEGVMEGALDDTPLLQTLVKAFKAGEAQ